ncbi:hypothetical protein FRC12_009161 [Ceratobasidium sp. 428]|nr:hypothetical protein FRC12_009161 [Ceratobasidium sp. 428]
MTEQVPNTKPVKLSSGQLDDMNKLFGELDKYTNLIANLRNTDVSAGTSHPTPVFRATEKLRTPGYLKYWADMAQVGDWLLNKYLPVEELSKLEEINRPVPAPPVPAQRRSRKKSTRNPTQKNAPAIIPAPSALKKKGPQPSLKRSFDTLLNT